MTHRLFIVSVAVLLSVASSCGTDDRPDLLDADSSDEVVTDDGALALPPDLSGTAWTVQFIDGNPVEDVGVSFTSLSRALAVLAIGHTDACGEGVVELQFFRDSYDVISVSYGAQDGCAPASSLATTFSVGEQVFIALVGGDQVVITTDDNEVLGRHFESQSEHGS